jgi:PAS domain S-box-containing protein
VSAYAEAVSTLARSADPQELMSRTCNSIVAQEAYVLAIVAMAEPLPTKPVRVAAMAGSAIGYADGLELSWAEGAALGDGPMGRAIRAGASYVVEDTLSDSVFAPWRERAARWGIRSAATAPFRRDDQIVGALAVYASEPNAFGRQEIDLFSRLGEYLTISISRAEAQQRLAATEHARSQAVEEMRRERDISNAILSNLPGILFIRDTEQRLIRWNDNLEHVLGRSSGDVANMRAIDMFKEDDKPRIMSAIDEIYATGCATREAELVPGDGGPRSYLFTKALLRLDGQDCILAIGADLTDHKLAEAALRESEARYRALFACAPDGILISDAAGRHIDANPALCQMLGCAAEDLIGADGAKIVIETAPEQVASERAAIASGRPYRRECLGRRADGSAFSAEAVTAAMPGGGTLLMLRDVTERRAAENRRQDAEKAAREMQAELARFGRLATLGEFVATIAHEVNQPLAAVRVNCDTALRWLATEPPNLEGARLAILRLISDSHRANEVITRIREFASRGEADFTELDINDAIIDILLMTAEGRERYHIALDEDLQAGALKVWGNRIQIQQVVLNLVTNAIEAMNHVAGRERTLTIRTALDRPERVLVSVQDTGGGFDAETARRLFEHFFTTKPGGTGLGLRISRSIVEAHGGRLWAEPLEPFGALFQFTVPTRAASNG